MEDVICPKCKNTMQFPFMVCPNCRWKPSDKEIDKQNYYARRYIVEHPGEAPQLKMVLEEVMEEVNKKREPVEKMREEAKKKKRVPAPTWFYIFMFIVGLLWIPGGITMLMEPALFLRSRPFILGIFTSFMCFWISIVMLIKRFQDRKKKS